MNQEQGHSTDAATIAESTLAPDFGWDVAKAQKALLLAVLLELASIVPQLGWPLYGGVLLVLGSRIRWGCLKGA